MNDSNEEDKKTKKLRVKEAWFLDGDGNRLFRLTSLEGYTFDVVDENE